MDKSKSSIKSSTVTTHLKALKSDPNVVEAKKMLLEAVAKQKKFITGIRPPNPELSVHYQEALDTLGKHRGGKLWYPYLGSGIGNGCLVELMDGSVKYDFIGGIGVHHFGHSHPEILSACIDGAISDVVMQGHLQQNTDQMELIDLLISESKMDHCFLGTSGSMSNDNALKIAMQKNQPAKRVLAFERGFAGRTWAMSQITEKPAVREGLPVQLGVDFIPFFDPAKPEESIKNAVNRLKNYIWRYPKDHALMLFELIQGEGGYYPGSKEFFRALMTILKDNHIAVHIDEIQTFGRTPKLFAFQHYGLEDLVDIVTIGKLSQVCALLFKDEYTPRSGLLSQTFTSSTTAIHAAKEIIHLMIREGFFGPEGKNIQVFKQFTKNFEQIRGRHPNLIKGPYGLGAMVAFTPLDGEEKRVMQFGQDLFQAGVLSFICGKDPTRIRFLVPVGVVKPQDIDNVTKIVEEQLVKAK
jgi:4-aminobutyrate aminotransferase-like enzyme